MKRLIARGFECVFFDYQNLLERIRSSYDQASGAAQREAYQTALDCEVLVLDDLGAHRVSDWVEDTVTSLITYRYNNNTVLMNRHGATYVLSFGGFLSCETCEGTDFGSSPLFEKVYDEDGTAVFRLIGP